MPQIAPAAPKPTPSPAATPAPTRELAEAILDLPLLRSLPGQRLWTVLIELAILLVAFYVVRALLHRVIRRATEAVAQRDEQAGQAGRAQRIRTLGTLGRSIATWALGFAVGVAMLSALGINVLGLIGTAGVAGLAVGFGAQKLVKDVITGFFLLLEDQYAVGDYVTINSVTGTVEELGMRITRVRDDDGKLFIFSNGDIGTVCNQSRGPVAGSFEIAVAASADADKAVEALNAAFAQSADASGLAGVARVAGVTAVTAAATTFKVSFRATTGHRPAEVALRLRETARDALRQAEIPLA